MKKTLVRSLLTPLAFLLTAPALHAAVSISSPPVPDPFPAIPSVADWSTLSVGAGAVATTPGDFDIKVIGATDASTITTTLGSSGTIPPSANVIARQNTGVNSGGITFLQTRATGNEYILLLATLVNNTGGALNSVRLTYEYSSASGTGVEEVQGLRAYLSMTGTPGSWVLIPGLSVPTTATFNAPDFLAATETLPSTLGDGGTMYLLWADQNSVVNPDASYHIRNFAAGPGINCTISGTPINPVRLLGPDASDPSDDTVSFSTTITGTGNLGPGWRITGGPSTGTTGSYGATRNFNVPIGDFAGGPLILRIEDQSTPACFFQANIVAPPLLHKVTAMNSPTITFSLSAVGDGSYAAPLTMRTEPGWAGGTTGAITLSNVQTQPAPSAGTLKYFHMTTNATLTTDPVDVSALKGGFLVGDLALSFYSTSNTGLDAGDALNFRIEVAQDGNFSNTAGGNLIMANIQDVPVGDAIAFGDSIAAANPHIDLGVLGFPADDFIFHPFSGTVAIPSNAPAPLARIVAQGIAGISNSEHVLIDNIVFRSDSGLPGGDSDGDGVSDADEAIMGTNPNNAADVLRLSRPTGNPPQITFPSKPGRFYRVYVSDAAAPASHLAVWKDSGLATLVGNGGNLMFTLAVLPGEPRRFARLHVMQADGPWPATFP